MANEQDHDALVVGTGFGGLYALYLLKKQGFDVLAIDSAADVGGTWYWNRYPGARSDVESHVYRYSWDKESLLNSPWPKNYLLQSELQEYFQRVARKHDLYQNIKFNTELKKATWNDKDNLWNVVFSTGETLTVRYLIGAIGLLHRKNVPDISGLDTFKGHVTHSSAWTPGIEWENKRIAVIGSGASGVQLVGALGEKAKALTHFIRHAQYVLPAAYRPVTAEERTIINGRYEKIWNDVFTSNFGFGFPEPNRPALSVSPEDRATIFQDLWDQGSGFRFLFGGFSDLAVDEAANKEAINFIHKKIKEIVKFPQKAE
jgi:cyclohexanone monooxygenase